VRVVDVVLAHVVGNVELAEVVRAVLKVDELQQPARLVQQDVALLDVVVAKADWRVQTLQALREKRHGVLELGDGELRKRARERAADAADAAAGRTSLFTGSFLTRLSQWWRFSKSLHWRPMGTLVSCRLAITSATSRDILGSDRSTHDSVRPSRKASSRPPARRGVSSEGRRRAPRLARPLTAELAEHVEVGGAVEAAVGERLAHHDLLLAAEEARVDAKEAHDNGSASLRTVASASASERDTQCTHATTRGSSRYALRELEKLVGQPAVQWLDHEALERSVSPAGHVLAAAIKQKETQLKRHFVELH
jgi:hypothetical protein